MFCSLKGKAEGLKIIRSGLHDNWDDAEGYYSKLCLLSFSFKNYCSVIIDVIFFYLECHTYVAITSSKL